MDKVKNELAEKFRRAEDRRHKRCAAERSVYAYKADGSDAITDNLLLLPLESEPAHRDFLRIELAGFGPDILSKFKDFSVVRIGHFNIRTLKFRSCPVKSILKIQEVIDDLGKVENK